MSRKFLFCFPLRMGNLIYGYVLILISLAVIAYHLYELGMNIQLEDELSQNEKFRNWENLEKLFGQNKNSLVAIVTISYYLTYIVLGLMLFLFTVLYIIGVYQVNRCLISTFFVYSFIHLFLSIGLIIWEATSKGYIQLGLIALFDVILIICLFGVKYLIEASRSGHIYKQPAENYGY